MLLNNTNINNIIQYTISNNSQQDFILFLVIFGVSVLLLKVFQMLLSSRIKKLSKKTKFQLDEKIIDFLEQITWATYVFLALYISSKPLALPRQIDVFFNYSLLFVLAIYGVKALFMLTDYYVEKEIKKRDKGQKQSLLRTLSVIVKLIIVVIAVLLVLSNIGINVTSIIAGLGIGGIALGFALKEVLDDIFASFSIYFDKPFEVGDFIVIGSGKDEDKGTVEEIGLKTTRIRHLKGHQLVVSNKMLTTSKINNYGRMKNRWEHFKIRVVYDTDAKQLEKIPTYVEDIIKKVENAKLDRVHFKEFGESSLDFEVAFYIMGDDYDHYLDIQQEINLAIKKKFEKENIRFAYPTRTVHMEK